jgi:hypothetical protein
MILGRELLGNPSTESQNELVFIITRARCLLIVGSGCYLVENLRVNQRSDASTCLQKEEPIFSFDTMRTLIFGHVPDLLVCGLCQGIDIGLIGFENFDFLN